MKSVERLYKRSTSWACSHVTTFAMAIMSSLAKGRLSSEW